jgi:hypothetical protein
MSVKEGRGLDGSLFRPTDTAWQTIWLGKVKKFLGQTLSCIKNALNKKQTAFSSNKI